jgi:hypothetical protein
MTLFNWCLSLTEVLFKTKASKELALDVLSSALERELKILKAKLAGFEKEMQKFEARYKLSSKEFYKKFENGELGDDESYFAWWAAVQAHKSIKIRIETLQELFSQCKQ